MIENTLESTSDLAPEWLIWLIVGGAVLCCLTMLPELCRVLRELWRDIPDTTDDAANIAPMCAPASGEHESFESDVADPPLCAKYDIERARAAELMPSHLN